MNPHQGHEHDAGTEAAWQDGGDPAGELQPQANPVSGRRATILAGLMIGAVAVGGQLSPAAAFGWTTFPSAP